jgi:ApbE superfamily uncharacterized protein (UPF0280 family)
MLESALTSAAIISENGAAVQVNYFAHSTPLVHVHNGGDNCIMENRITLIGLDIEGEWNVPLLKNAAEKTLARLEAISGKLRC